ncbi:hypothetical protein G6011_03589 [Alternaria panax]|uniref:Uncharacterized protein n=1 Tax=Alternaria panax TaxID=48097 RepID=A0AAD4NTB6_9PLEO|nr:hypothetical protein G6011_03589 [Alternaria panax]
MSLLVPPQTASLLLRIPGELRNLIYGLALSDADGLIFGYRKPPNHHKVLAGYNQLKFTCKQLSRETARLEIKYNKILFVQLPHQDSAGEQFIRLLKRLPPFKHAWLSEVILIDDSTPVQYGSLFTSAKFRQAMQELERQVVRESGSIAEAIGEFCKAHPQTPVTYHFSSWCFPEPKGIYWNNFPEHPTDVCDAIHFVCTAIDLIKSGRKIFPNPNSHSDAPTRATRFKTRLAVGTAIDETFVEIIRDAQVKKSFQAEVLYLARALESKYQTSMYRGEKRSVVVKERRSRVETKTRPRY